MKKLLPILLLVLITNNIFSQSYTIKVTEVQNFNHELMNTLTAVKENKIEYKENGITNSTYSFDLTDRKLVRNMDGIKGDFEIVKIYKTEHYFDVDVKFTNGIVANYMLCDVLDTKNKTLICRWVSDNKIKGWFDVDVK